MFILKFNTKIVTFKSAIWITAISILTTIKTKIYITIVVVARTAYKKLFTIKPISRKNYNRQYYNYHR